MPAKPLLTGNSKTDEALNSAYIILNRCEDRIANLEKELSAYRSLSERKFTVISENATTKKLIIGDESSGNYSTIGSDGVITVFST